MENYTYTGLPRKPYLEYIHEGVSSSSMSNKSLEYCNYSGLTLHVFFRDTLSQIDEDKLNDIVIQSYELPGKKSEKKDNVKSNSDLYINGRYEKETQINLTRLLDESVNKGYSDRRDYIQPWSSWVESVKEYVNNKMDDIDNASDLSSLESITWDFSTFDSSDPEINIKDALGLSGSDGNLVVNSSPILLSFFKWGSNVKDSYLYIGFGVYTPSVMIRDGKITGLSWNSDGDAQDDGQIIVLKNGSVTEAVLDVYEDQTHGEVVFDNPVFFDAGDSIGVYVNEGKIDRPIVLIEIMYR